MQRTRKSRSQLPAHHFSLDPYLRLFDNISWNIEDRLNLEEIYFIEPNEPITQNSELFAQLNVPLNTHPIVLNFPNFSGPLEYRSVALPAGMTAIQILAAIDRYLHKPIRIKGEDLFPIDFVEGIYFEGLLKDDTRGYIVRLN